MVQLENRKKSISESEMLEFESLFLTVLPESFKAYYYINNGGHLSEEDNEAGLWGLPVGGFNSIKYGSVPIEQLLSDIGDIGKIGDGGYYKLGSYVPFAYDDGGHTIFLSLNDEDYGCVFIFEFDFDEIEAVKISDSFSEFIKKLYRQ